MHLSLSNLFSLKRLILGGGLSLTVFQLKIIIIMLNTLHDRCHYDPEKKIWLGSEETFYYDKDKSIGDIIFEEMRRHPKNIAQISATEGTVLTKEELLTDAKRIATFFRNVSLTQDDIIASTARNTTYMAPLAYACFFNGTAIHTLNPSYEEETFRHLFAITKPKYIFCDALDYEKVLRASKDLTTKVYVLNRHISPEVPTIFDILQTQFDQDFRPLKLQQGINQTLAILCSSGTTGTPKAVTLTNCHRSFSYFGFVDSTDVQYSPSTLDWLSGLLTLLTSGIFGTTRIISDQPFDALSFLQMVPEFCITSVILTPPHIGMILNCPELKAEKLDSIKYFFYGGSNCTLASHKHMRKYIRNGRCIYGYGCTEAGTVMTWNCDVNSEKLGSVGVPLNGTSVKIIDEDGNSLGHSQKGEICLRNDCYWAGYYNNEQATKEMKDAFGWLHTADLGYFDEDNYLFIVDRKKDMLKYLNIMYYPNELEEVIAQMPEVIEVCVFGIWDDAAGDAAAAAIVKRYNSKLTAQDVIAYVREHIDAKYKQLNGGAIIIDELLKSPNGKLNRRAIKEHCLPLIAPSSSSLSQTSIS